MHIPDKPHDGLFLTGLAVKSSTTNIPFLIGAIPYLGYTQKIEDLIMEFIKLFQPNQIVHFILDARFASVKLFEIINSKYKNTFLTMSMKESSYFAFKIMKNSTRQGCWKAVYNKKQECILSLLKNRTEEEGRNYILLTSAFYPQSEVLLGRTNPWDLNTLGSDFHQRTPWLLKSLSQSSKTTNSCTLYVLVVV